MLNRDFEALTVNGICDLSTKNILAGSPLTYGANGYKLAKAGDPFVGLSYNYYHTGKNDVTGGEWFADSGKVGVVKIALVTLGGDEIDGAMVYPFDHTAAWAVGDGVAVNADGLLVKADSDADAVATVVSFDAQRGLLQVFVNATK